VLIAAQNLTRDEWRTLGIGALGAAFGAIASGVVSWGFEEAKRIVHERREAVRKEAA